jgi:hypothetical protein
MKALAPKSAVATTKPLQDPATVVVQLPHTTNRPVSTEQLALELNMNRSMLKRPNPSFNLTFSGWLRQPPNAS